MREVLSEIEAWGRAGEDVALATVVSTWGSAPRREGAKLALTAGGRLAGSVSGGCVEGAVVEAGRRVLKSGRAELQRFGVTDGEAWAVGLSCGGEIEVLVEPLHRPSLEPVAAAIRAERSAALATAVAGPEAWLGRKRWQVAGEEAAGSIDASVDAAVADALAAGLAEGRSRRVSLESPEGSVELFVDVQLPSPTLVVVGGVHIAVALTRIAGTLGYRSLVVDPRPVFGSEERFPHVARLVPEWPDEALGRIGLNAATAVAVLTHDPKLDDPALREALPSPAFYVGALGSRKTQQKRRERLLAAGLSEEVIARLHAPIGLDLGGRSPEEIALAVMAQIVAARHGRSPAPKA